MSTLQDGLRLIAWSLEGGNARMADDCREAADALDAAEAKLAAIDARHIKVWSPRLGYHVCFTCAEPFGKWPCADHLTLHPEESS